MGTERARGTTEPEATGNGRSVSGEAPCESREGGPTNPTNATTFCVWRDPTSRALSAMHYHLHSQGRGWDTMIGCNASSMSEYVLRQLLSCSAP